MTKTEFPKIFALIVAIIGIFLILMSTIKEPVIEEEVREEKPAEIHALGEEIIKEKIEIIEEVPEEKPIIEPQPEVIEQPIVKTFISDEKCENGIISLRLNNLFDDTINVKMSTFFVSGQISPKPGCDRYLLTPGESTFCDNVGSFARKGKRRVAIAIYKHTTVGVTVDCGSNFVTGSVIEETPYYGFSPVFFVLMLFFLLFVFNYYRVHY